MEPKSHHDQYDHPVFMIYSSVNSFTISPITPYSPQKSLIIDKKSSKIAETDLIHRDSEPGIGTIEVSGLLGIVNILGSQYLLVITDREEIGTLPVIKSKTDIIKSTIFALDEVDLIPFDTISDGVLDRVRVIKDRLKKYLEYGLFFSYTCDMS